MITKIDIKEQTVKSYVIRKLTPTECFRLMGLHEDTISHIRKKKDGKMLISNTQQYKMAGNSIVVDVLTGIYEKLWYSPLSVIRGGQKTVITTFSGYDSQLLACEALKEKHPNFGYDCAGWSEIDKFACQAHNMIFPQYADRALGDITTVDWHKVKENLKGKEVDLFTYSSPCQDISTAGKKAGLKEGSGTRSALLWNVADAVAVLKPRFLLQENVPALVSKRFMPDFQCWLGKLKELGYTSKWALLNAKDYGVPQNRNRVFCLSMRQDVAFDFQFPKPMPLTTHLEDILEEDIDDKYFLSDSTVERFLERDDRNEYLFTSFDLPPTHESAMWIKTWIQEIVKESGGWEMSGDVLSSLIDKKRPEILSTWATKGEIAERNSSFMSAFKANMED